MAAGKEDKAGHRKAFWVEGRVLDKRKHGTRAERVQNLISGSAWLAASYTQGWSEGDAGQQWFLVVLALGLRPLKPHWTFGSPYDFLNDWTYGLFFS